MKAVKLISVVVFLTMVLSSNSCSDEDFTKLKVCNSFNKAIYVSFSTWYPDTTIINPSPYYNRNHDKIEVNSIQKEWLKSASEGLFISSKIDTLSLFVFDADLIESHYWDTIKANYSILCRYDLSLSDLKKLNWIVPYPPTVEMKDMHMYPRYGSVTINKNNGYD